MDIWQWKANKWDMENCENCMWMFLLFFFFLPFREWKICSLTHEYYTSWESLQALSCSVISGLWKQCTAQNQHHLWKPLDCESCTFSTASKAVPLHNCSCSEKPQRMNSATAVFITNNSNGRIHLQWAAIILLFLFNTNNSCFSFLRGNTNEHKGNCFWTPLDRHATNPRHKPCDSSHLSHFEQQLWDSPVWDPF